MSSLQKVFEEPQVGLPSVSGHMTSEGHRMQGRGGIGEWGLHTKLLFKRTEGHSTEG